MNIHSILNTDAQWASLLLRLPTGITFVAHGAQKLFSWFGGYGLEGTAQLMTSQGLEPGFFELSGPLSTLDLPKPRL